MRRRFTLQMVPRNELLWALIAAVKYARYMEKRIEVVVKEASDVHPPDDRVEHYHKGRQAAYDDLARYIERLLSTAIGSKVDDEA